MTTTLTPSLTLEDFLKQPETQPATEFIDGKIHQKPMPKGKHSRLQFKLCDAINQVTEPDKVALAFPELRCSFGGRSLVSDVTVFAWSRLPLDGNGEIEDVFSIPPDWTIEILSPDQKPMQVIKKILFCLTEGTQLGWLIDPADYSIWIFRPEQQPIAISGDKRLLLPNFVALELTVAQVFDWLKVG